MKKLINDPDAVVAEMVEGMTLAHPDRLKRIEGTNALARRNKKKDKVALVSGGGSGHEPAHAGYIGEGMLDAAVAGEVFTSPTPDQILAAIKEADTGKGVLLIIKNYSGDVMNFDMAADLAANEGIETEKVVVADDVAISDPEQRRGIAGTILVHKIAGAMAEQGGSLQDVKAVAEKAIANVRTMGVSLAPSTVPAVGKPGFEIADDEMELGTGIHGEQGMKRTQIQSADGVAESLLSLVLDDLLMSSKDTASVMVNGLGATPRMELYILYRKVAHMLEEKGIQSIPALIGEYMTSLEMAGVSVTLLKLDQQLNDLLQSPANTIAWRCHS